MRLTHIPVVWISTWIGRHAVPYFRSVLLVLVRAADAADLCRIGSYCFASLAWSEDRSATCFRNLQILLHAVACRDFLFKIYVGIIST